MAKILPIKKPILSTYPGQSFLLSIVLTHESGMDWFNENYVGLVTKNGRIDNKPFMEADFLNYPTLKKWNNYQFSSHQIYCPLLASYAYDPIYIYKNNSIIDFIKYYIDEGSYIVVHLDRRYTLNYKSYNLHEAFIYGYDEINKLIFIGEYIEAFEVFTISYSDIENAFISACQNRSIFFEEVRIFVLSLKNITYSFNKDNLKKALIDYSNSTEPVVGGRSLYLYGYWEKWGISIYRSYIEYLQYLLNSEQWYYLDKRHWHLLYEHKLSLRLKTELLINEIDDLNPKSLLTEITWIEKNSLIMRNLALKYNISRSKEVLKKIYSILLIQYEKEKEFINNLLDVAF